MALQKENKPQQVYLFRCKECKTVVCLDDGFWQMVECPSCKTLQPFERLLSTGGLLVLGK